MIKFILLVWLATSVFNYLYCSMQRSKDDD
jgi:hypothetical protein